MRIWIEGVNGVGKTTQANLLTYYIKDKHKINAKYIHYYSILPAAYISVILSKTINKFLGLQFQRKMHIRGEKEFAFLLKLVLTSLILLNILSSFVLISVLELFYDCLVFDRSPYSIIIRLVKCVHPSLILIVQKCLGRRADKVVVLTVKPSILVERLRKKRNENISLRYYSLTQKLFEKSAVLNKNIKIIDTGEKSICETFLLTKKYE